MGLNQWADDRADDERSDGDRSAPRHGRAALLRLASWFEEAGQERADALAGAAYALYPARHLKGRVDDGVAATTAWWQAEPDRSTVIERPGTRPPEPVRDHRAQQSRLRDAAESSAHWRRTGAAQVRALLSRPTGPRAHLDLSGAGMEVLMELLTAALGSGDAGRRPTSAGDLEFSLRLHVVSAPGSEVVIQGEGGELTLEGLRLCVTPYEQHEPDPSLFAPRTGTAPSASSGTPAALAAPAPAVLPTPSGPSAPSEAPEEDASAPSAAPETDAPAPSAVSATAARGSGPTAPDTTPAEEAPSDARARPGEQAPPPGAPVVDPPTPPVPVTEDEDDTTDDTDPDTRTTGPIDLGRDRPWTRTWG
ncbi:DUF2397 family protein [Nocardiopsis lambiniae]|uniref:DUF2397 family protein n=1 Tax=Nocardiopsis lambiniae TaxID=3075539 RepID=A0ABU2MF88_9ACTN|nr:DUF2397 family protein [Nocardiopsis sp. DSM 44743]MDT0331368.1 DUF2397 family protein [Nocardiopsis sp. DSM 44743]